MSSHDCSVNSTTEIDSEDEWYSRMEQAVYLNSAGLDTVTIVSCESNVVAIRSEEQYYEDMWDTNCRVSEAIFLPEGNSAWTNLLRINAQSVQPPENSTDTLVMLSIHETSCMLITKDFLFSKLPVTSHLYTDVIATLVGDTDGSQLIFTDHTLQPSLTMVVHPDKIAGNLNVLLFSRLSPTDVDWGRLSRTLQWLVTSTGLRNLTLQAMISDQYNAFKERSMAAAGLREMWVEVCEMYALIDAPAPEVLPLPPGYYFDKLSVHDADIVNDTWKYKSEHSIDKVRNMIEKYCCVGIRARQGECDTAVDPLACWCLTYSNGALGMLFTLEAHRKLGLARCVVTELIRRSAVALSVGMQHTVRPSAPPFCFIESSNFASKSLFCRALGFCRQSDALWVGLQSTTSEQTTNNSSCCSTVE